MKNADTFEMNKNWTALCTSQAGDANQEQHSLAKFMMECTIGIQGIRCILPCLWVFIYPWSPTGEYDLAHQPPSLVAAASLLLSLKLTNAPAVTFDWFLIHVSQLLPQETFSQLWTNNLEYYSTYTCTDLVWSLANVWPSVLVIIFDWKVISKTYPGSNCEARGCGCGETDGSWVNDSSSGQVGLLNAHHVIGSGQEVQDQEAGASNKLARGQGRGEKSAALWTSLFSEY